MNENLENMHEKQTYILKNVKENTFKMQKGNDAYRFLWFHPEMKNNTSWEILF